MKKTQRRIHSGDETEVDCMIWNKQIKNSDMNRWNPSILLLSRPLICQEPIPADVPAERHSTPQAGCQSFMERY